MHHVYARFKEAVDEICKEKILDHNYTLKLTEFVSILLYMYVLHVDHPNMLIDRCKELHHTI